MEPLKFGIFDWVEASATLAPAEVYAHKLDLAAAADAAGFHGMFLAEHQGTPLSIDGSPSVLLSAIFQRTRRLRAGALGSACRGTTPTASTTRCACSITSPAAASSSAWGAACRRSSRRSSG